MYIHIHVGGRVVDALAQLQIQNCRSESHLVIENFLSFGEST